MKKPMPPAKPMPMLTPAPKPTSRSERDNVAKQLGKSPEAFSKWRKANKGKNC